MPCKIRVSNINLDDEQFVEFIHTLTRTPNTAIVVKEHTPKDHYHVYLEDNLSLPTIRKKLAENCPTKNNDSYSVSDKHDDWEGYKSYLFKYPETTILYCNEDVEKYRELYKLKSSTFQKYTEYTRIYRYVMDLHSPKLPKLPNPKEIVKYVIQYYLKEGKIFHKAHIAQIVHTIYYQNNQNSERYILSVLEEADLVEEDCEIDHLRMENRQLKIHLKSWLRHRGGDIDNPE